VEQAVRRIGGNFGEQEGPGNELGATRRISPEASLLLLSELPCGPPDHPYDAAQPLICERRHYRMPETPSLHNGHVLVTSRQRWCRGKLSVFAHRTTSVLARGEQVYCHTCWHMHRNCWKRKYAENYHAEFISFLSPSAGLAHRAGFGPLRSWS